MRLHRLGFTFPRRVTCGQRAAGRLPPVAFKRAPSPSQILRIAAVGHVLRIIGVDTGGTPALAHEAEDTLGLEGCVVPDSVRA